MEMNKAAAKFNAEMEVEYPEESVLEIPRWHASKFFKMAALAMVDSVEMPDEPDVVKTLRTFAANSATAKIVRYIDTLKEKIVTLEVEIDILKVHDV